MKKKIIYSLAFLIVVVVLFLSVASIYLHLGLKNFSSEIEVARAQTYETPKPTKETEKEVTINYTVSDAAEDYFIEKGHPMKEIISSEMGISKKTLSKANPNSNFNRVGEQLKVPLGTKRTFENKCASFYRGKFEGRKTASGETFRTLKIDTVASKFLPLGTKIEIKNLKNGVKREAVVNDRGPYYPSCKIEGEVVPRTLDLSWGLAATLWMTDSKLEKAREMITAGQFQKVNLERIKDFDRKPSNAAEKGLRKALSEGIMPITYTVIKIPETT